MMEKKDNSSIFDNQTTIKTTTTITAASSHCCYQEDPLSTIPPLSKCNHKYFSGITQSSKLVCDSCNKIIGEWKFSFTYDVKKSFPQSQYLIYKIYPYLRRLTVEEVQDLV
jgi:hypothetical protein